MSGYPGGPGISDDPNGDQSQSYQKLNEYQLQTYQDLNRYQPQPQQNSNASQSQSYQNQQYNFDNQAYSNPYQGQGSAPYTPASVALTNNRAGASVMTDQATPTNTVVQPQRGQQGQQQLPVLTQPTRFGLLPGGKPNIIGPVDKNLIRYDRTACELRTDQRLQCTLCGSIYDRPGRDSPRGLKGHLENKHQVVGDVWEQYMRVLAPSYRLTAR